MTSILVAVGLTACGVRIDLDIVNKTDDPVFDVAISDGQTVWELGDLQPNGSRNFDRRISGGGPQISWTFRGVRYSESGCYYTESWPGMPAEGAIGIEGEHLGFRCSGDPLFELLMII